MIPVMLLLPMESHVFAFFRSPCGLPLLRAKIEAGGVNPTGEAPARYFPCHKEPYAGIASHLTGPESLRLIEILTLRIFIVEILHWRILFVPIINRFNLYHTQNISYRF